MEVHVRHAVALFILLCLPLAGNAGEKEESLPPRSGSSMAPPKDAPPRNDRLVQAEKRLLGRDRDRAASPPPNGWKLTLQLAATVTLFAGLIIACLLAAKRWLPGSRQLFSHPGLEVLGRTHLDSRRYLALVRVGRRLLVLGASPDTLTPLGEVTDPAEVTELLAIARPKSEPGKSLFRTLFARQLQETETMTESVRTEASAEQVRDGISELRERVRDLRNRE